MILDILKALDVVLRPSVTLADVAQQLRKLFAADPLRGAQAIGQMYGHAFRKAEAAYAARGFQGRQPWTR